MQKRIELVEKRLAPMFKIVLLDYSMPEMDGPTTAEEMWRLFRNSSIITNEKLQPYICCCTAYVDEEYKSKAIAAGMDYFLTKPISYEILLQLLELLKWIEFSESAWAYDLRFKDERSRNHKGSDRLSYSSCLYRSCHLLTSKFNFK